MDEEYQSILARIGYCNIARVEESGAFADYHVTQDGKRFRARFPDPNGSVEDVIAEARYRESCGRLQREFRILNECQGVIGIPKFRRYSLYPPEDFKGAYDGTLLAKLGSGLLVREIIHGNPLPKEKQLGDVQARQLRETIAEVRKKGFALHDSGSENHYLVGDDGIVYIDDIGWPVSCLDSMDRTTFERHAEWMREGVERLIESKK